ncbi:MAG: hypothetical protein NXI08_14470 [bacterium]|nr:hypothetical protein [bacterium]
MNFKAYYPLLILSLVVGITGWSCTQEGRCEGTLVVENPIEDITMSVGETLFIDLTNPPVFVSSEGRVIYDISYLSVEGAVRIIFANNPNDNGHLSMIKLTALDKGEDFFQLSASHGCLENQLNFKVTVIKP